jgi:hypothetical protein
LFSALVADTSAALGAEHPDALESRASLAALTDLEGDKAGACHQLGPLLAQARQVLGPHDRVTHAVRWHLILLERELGG